MKRPEAFFLHHADKYFSFLLLGVLHLLLARNYSFSSEPSFLQPLSIPVSSFGAVAVNESIFVYGGHTAPVHEWSKKAVTGDFFELNLQEVDATWHPLDSGQALQGMNIIAYKGHIYRAGGMEPRNEQGDSADNFSVATVSRFSLQNQKWEAFKPLPEPRSSHDVILNDGIMYVVGGWDMRGESGGEYWCDTIAFIDLNASEPSWQTLEQPFFRRALIAASFQDQIWVVGGFTDNHEITREVNVFDIKKSSWSLAPQLPEGQFNGFASAACVFEDQLIVSVADGKVLKLSKNRKRWKVIAHTKPRIVHRMVPVTDGVILLGGAHGRRNLDTVELIEIP